MFRARRWTFLLDLIEGLPSSSRTTTAALNDPDEDRVAQMAETITAQEAAAEEGQDAPAGGRSLVGRTAEVQVLEDIFDVVVAALGGRTRYPRPVTRVAEAVEEIRQTTSLQAAEDIISVMTPWALEA